MWTFSKWSYIFVMIFVQNLVLATHLKNPKSDENENLSGMVNHMSSLLGINTDDHRLNDIINQMSLLGVNNVLLQSSKNSFKESRHSMEEEEDLDSRIERIPARTYLDNIRAQSMSNSSKSALVMEDRLSLILANYLPKSDSWTPFSKIRQNHRHLLIKQHPLFKAAAALDPFKVSFQVIPGGSHGKDLLRLDPVTGLVYRTCTISLMNHSNGKSEILQEAKFVLVLTTKLEANADGTVNVWVKLASTKPFVPFQMRIRLDSKVLAIPVASAAEDVPVSIFTQPFQPGHFLVPVLARHDLPESSPNNHYIYISIEEHTYNTSSDMSNVEDPLSKSTICVWVINGGPGAKVSDMRFLAEDLIPNALMSTSSTIGKVRVVLVEQRGIGQSHRLAPSRRLDAQNADDPWSAAIIDLPINQYGSAAAAADLISIVKAYERMQKDELLVHLAYAVSYGTRLVSSAIRMAPKLFHTVILGSMDAYVGKIQDVKDFGPFEAIKNHQLYSAYQKDLSSRLMEAFEGLKDEHRMNPCKVILKQSRHFAYQPSLVDGFIEMSSEYRRLDLILFLLLQVHECTDVVDSKDAKGGHLSNLIDLIEQTPDEYNFEEEVAESLYKAVGSNVSGTILFQLIEWLERYQMSPAEYYLMNCQDLADPAERFMNHFTCRDAQALSESFQRLAKEHPQLADQIVHTKPINAKLANTNPQHPSTHVIIIQGALDKVTDLGFARKAATDLARDSFKVDMIIKPLGRHGTDAAELKWCLQKFHQGINFAAGFKKINDGRSLHTEWISKRSPKDALILDTIRRNGFEGLETMLALGNESYIYKLVERNPKDLPALYSWFDGKVKMEADEMSDEDLYPKIRQLLEHLESH